MVLESILDPIFRPLLSLPSFVGIFIISLGLTIVTTLAYKYLTDQKKMKAIKEDMKKYQAKIKVLSKENPEKAMKVQKEMMAKNMEMMKHSFRPMLFTFIPLIIIFGWLNSHMAYESLSPQEQFDVTLTMVEDASGEVAISSIPPLAISKEDGTFQEIVDGEVSWTMKGDAGDYTLTFEHDDVKVSKEILISELNGDYKQPLEKYKEGAFKEILVGNTKIQPMTGVPLIGGFGWLGTYILLSFALSFGLRKALNIA